ncbi:magnesium transporter [Mycena galericulata]|nr:magnesium transporter [Mycena galericulata]
MPRENSFTDSDGRSLTPDLEAEVNPFPLASPSHVSPTTFNFPIFHKIHTKDPVPSRPTATRLASPTVLPPKARFRHVVRKTIMILRMSTDVLARRGRVAGAEPGVDPRQASADAEFGWMQQECAIQVVDYSAVRSTFRPMTNGELIELMNDSGKSERASWVKVRWINIGGMNWDVMKAVALRYDLHPLALDDVLRSHPRARSKADYYAQHLFLRVLCHELADGVAEEPPEASDLMITNLPRSESPTGLQGEPLGSAPLISRFMQMRATVTEARKQRRIRAAALRALKSGERVDVNVYPMSIFLFRDGTVISIHSTPSLEMMEPITNRLRQFDGRLRASADASLLVQSLLSLVTDKALEVVNAYQDKIKKFERQIMSKPSTDTARDLHILATDLLLHRRTLAPVQTVVYGLRRYDVDRAAAIVDTSTEEGKGIKVAGFMSRTAIVYLADVHDHMEYVLGQLDVIAGIGENLIDYTFNMTSYHLNEVMRRLMLVTITFLPLSFLTGYFGMNFDFMWTTHGPGTHTDLLFWEITLPVWGFVVAVFLTSDIKRMWHYVRKRGLANKVVKSFKYA